MRFARLPLALQTAPLAAAFLLCACGPSASTKQAAAPAEQKKEAAKTMSDVYRVRFDTSKGPFTVEVHKAWAPMAAERFWRLVDLKFFDRSRVFRVKRGFVAQFGVSADPRTNEIFNSLPIKDDPVKQSNTKGTVSFAASGPGSRRTQVFINLRDNRSLDKQGFAPFAKVVDGMDSVEKFYSGYGEMAPLGAGPDPNKLALEGDSYARAKFPWLETIKTASVVE